MLGKLGSQTPIFESGMKYLASTDNPDYEEQGNQDRLWNARNRDLHDLSIAHTLLISHIRAMFTRTYPR